MSLVFDQCQNSYRWAGQEQAIPTLASDWLPAYAWYWSAHPSALHRLAIVSSRLPKRLDPRGVWIESLRAALELVADRKSAVLVSDGTAGARLVQRGAARGGLSCVRIRPAEHTFPDPVGAAIARPNGLLQMGNPELVHLCYVPIIGPTAGREPDLEIERVPPRDRALVAWADALIVLGLRSNGNLHHLLRRRLERQPGAVLLVDLPGLRPRRLQQELVRAGAELWAPRPGSQRCSETTRQSPSEPGAPIPSARSAAEDLNASRRCTVTAIVAPSYARQWDCLIHCTRACPGPWLGQTEQEYLDSLLDDAPGADHSALACLLRIVSQQRLLGSSQAIRGGYRVVSFTAVPLAELHRMHVFRPHRGRWDFEPYGLCIRRGWLEAHGARPVFYGDESTWSALGESDRPFFQVARSRRKGSEIGAIEFDWSQEHEWRCVGDLKLDRLPGQDGLVFVPTREAAAQICRVSPWPVTVLNDS